MLLLQMEWRLYVKISATKLTYKEFAVKLLKLVLLHAKNAKRVDIVFDCYIKNSIKDVERMRRSHGNGYTQTNCSNISNQTVESPPFVWRFQK